MVMPEHPDRFIAGREGGLFSFSKEKVAVGENTDRGKTSRFPPLLVGTGSLFNTFNNCSACSGPEPL